MSGFRIIVTVLFCTIRFSDDFCFVESVRPTARICVRERRN